MAVEIVILAAGRGSRLGALGTSCSKAMLPIMGVPLIRMVLDTLGCEHAKRIIVVAAPGDSALREYLAGSGLPHEVVIQDEARGAGHALLLLKDRLKGPFFVSACDSFTSRTHICELLSTQNSSASDAVLSLLSVPETQSLAANSVVELRGDQVIKVTEKPSPEQRTSNVMCTPLYVLSPTIFSALEDLTPSSRGEIELVPAIQARISQGADVRGVFTPSRMQVTTQEDLLNLNLKAMHGATHAPVVQGQNCIVDPSAQIVEPVWMEDGQVIEHGAVIGPYVYLGRGSRVSANARLSHCILIAGASVAADSCHDQRVLFPSVRPATSSTNAC